MTKKDYELIAGGIRQGLLAVKGHNIRTEAVTMTAKFLAIELKLDNPRFNKTKFLQACGIETPNMCPKYNEPVMPDENGMCSLCGLHEA